MSLRVCPHCNQRFVVGFGVTDFVHNCNSGNKAIDQEDVVITGDWEDSNGSGNISPQQVLMQGVENKLQGTRAGIEGDDKEDITRRGARASTRRQRQHLEFINIKENKNGQN